MASKSGVHFQPTFDSCLIGLTDKNWAHEARAQTNWCHNWCHNSLMSCILRFLPCGTERRSKTVGSDPLVITVHLAALTMSSSSSGHAALRMEGAHLPFFFCQELKKLNTV